MKLRSQISEELKWDLSSYIANDKEIEETFKILKDSEFENVNTDIMIGLQGQSINSILAPTALSLPITSLYPLRI